MKIILKLLLAVLACLNFFESNAQSKDCIYDETLKPSVVVYTGTNVLEQAPIYGGAVSVKTYFICSEIDIGHSYISPGDGFAKTKLLYLSCSFGLFFPINKNCEIYVMLSGINWGTKMLKGAEGNDSNSDVFYTNKIYPRTKTGININIDKHLFINTDVGYMFAPTTTKYYQYYKNLSIRVGLGYCF